jgi:hypothetical protein
VAGVAAYCAKKESRQHRCGGFRVRGTLGGEEGIASRGLTAMREMVWCSLTSAEHLLHARHGKLSGLSLNFRIVVASDLDSVAVNAKAGG